MASGARWTREELMLALHLYWRLPFGQQSQTNHEIIHLAGILGRTPSSIAMKLNNLTSLDPDEQARGVKGLAGASARDREVWDWSVAHKDAAVAEMEALWQEKVEGLAPPSSKVDAPVTDTPLAAFGGAAMSVSALTQARRGQEFFRRTVLANFQQTCALTGLANPTLLRASHIVSWAESAEHRVNPSNGLALNALHDAAFDKHLLTFDEDLRLIVGKRLRDSVGKSAFMTQFLAYEGQPLRATYRVPVDGGLMAAHRARYLEREAG